MLSSLHAAQPTPTNLLALNANANGKRRNTKKNQLSQKVEATLKSSSKNDLRSSPSFIKYESTNSTSNCDDEELKINLKGKEVLRLKLKRKINFNTEDEYDAALCLITLKRRHRSSDIGDEKEKSLKVD